MIQAVELVILWVSSCKAYFVWSNIALCYGSDGHYMECNKAKYLCLDEGNKHIAAQSKAM